MDVRVRAEVEDKMQITRPNFVSDLLTRLELTYSSLKVDAYVVFGLIALVTLIMCGGAYQAAVQQASLYLGVTPQQDPTLMQIANLVNQYGLAVLIAICYVSNVTRGGKRRELLVDAICVAVGFLLPQLTFHATWLYVTRELIITQAMLLNSAVVSAIHMEWVTVLGATLALVALALQSWRIAHRGSASKPTARIQR
jgi:hypothetical protein